MHKVDDALSPGIDRHHGKANQDKTDGDDQIETSQVRRGCDESLVNVADIKRRGGFLKMTSEKNTARYEFVSAEQNEVLWSNIKVGSGLR